jgi:hypothetical protein
MIVDCDHTYTRCCAHIQVKEKQEVSWTDLANLGQVGAGAFGSVHLMTNLKNDCNYALKVNYIYTVDLRNKK